MHRAERDRHQMGDQYVEDVNFGLRLLGEAEASADRIRDMFNCGYDTDEAAEAIAHYRKLDGTPR